MWYVCVVSVESVCVWREYVECVCVECMSGVVYYEKSVYIFNFMFYF